MRFGNSRVSFRTLLFSKKETYQKILTMNLDLSSTEAEQVLDLKNSNTPDVNRRNILNNPRHRIINNCQICQKFNIDVKSLNDLRSCLGLTSFKLEHRINVFKDIGVPELNVSLLNRITRLLNKPVFKFKKDTNIPLEENICKNVLNKFGESLADIFNLEPFSDKMPTRRYYETCLLHCKTRIFDLPYLDDKLLLHDGMKFKSISMIVETLKVLRHDLNYDSEMIKKYPIIITASADNIKSLMKSFQDEGICGIPIIEILKKYPYMVFEDADNIKQLLLSFKRYEIPDEYIVKYMRILTMGNDIFLERIKEIKRHPDLHLWHKYPGILQLVAQKGMVYDRVGFLRFLNRMKWARLSTVLTPKRYMDRFLEYSNNTLISRKCLKYLFANELGKDKTDLIELLTRHQYWKTVSFADVEQMLKYLKMNFTIDEICQNIHIILYARPIVEKLLADLKEQYSQHTEFSFTNSQYLALCLYMLEKDSHFTGDSIWSSGHNVKQYSTHLLGDQNIRNESNNDTNIMEDINNNLDINYSVDISSDLNDKDKTSDTT